MQFTQKSKEHIDSCRFCWMCHHVCPIGNATGLERNTARARALGLSLVMRDAIEYSDDIINNVYECSLCGGCMTDCVTGWDPVMFTREARLGAALDGKLPEYVMTMLQNLNEKGNIYGADKNENIPEIKGGDILFFLGEDTRAKGCAKTAVELLKKAGVDFTLLKDEPNSGYSIDFLIGAAAETKAVMENCAKVLNGYKKVVCYDPCDAKVMIEGSKIAKQNGTKVLYDAGGLYEGVENLLPYADILIPSEEFALGHTKTKNAEDATKLLFKKYSPEIVVITQGKNGGIIYDGTTLESYPAFLVDAVDSNGSGDVFHGAFAFAVINNMDYKKACVFSSAVSALKCTKVGAREGVPTYEETINFLKERGINV